MQSQKTEGKLPLVFQRKYLLTEITKNGSATRKSQAVGSAQDRSYNVRGLTLDTMLGLKEMKTVIVPQLPTALGRERR